MLEWQAALLDAGDALVEPLQDLIEAKLTIVLRGRGGLFLGHTRTYPFLPPESRCAVTLVVSGR